MEAEKLIEVINERSKEYDTALVTVDEFFEQNSNRWSFAANACSEELDVHSFYKIFSRLSGLDQVQCIWIEIVDMDADGPYSDSVYIAADLQMEELKEYIIEYMKEGFPDDIIEIPDEDEIREQISGLKEGCKLYFLWWD